MEFIGLLWDVKGEPAMKNTTLPQISDKGKGAAISAAPQEAPLTSKPQSANWHHTYYLAISSSPPCVCVCVLLQPRLGLFHLSLERIFISGRHGRNWPQQRTKPCPVNIFLQRAERRHGCPTQAIPGSSISMSFQPYQVLPHSKRSYSAFRRCVQSKHAC